MTKVTAKTEATQAITAHHLLQSAEIVWLLLIVSTSSVPRLPNAPVQARWANAQRAGLPPPNTPNVACNRLLGSPRVVTCQKPLGRWLTKEYDKRDSLTQYLKDHDE